MVAHIWLMNAHTHTHTHTHTLYSLLVVVGGRVSYNIYEEKRGIVGERERERERVVVREQSDLCSVDRLLLLVCALSVRQHLSLFFRWLVCSLSYLPHLFLLSGYRVACYFVVGWGGGRVIRQGLKETGSRKCLRAGRRGRKYAWISGCLQLQE